MGADQHEHGNRPADVNEAAIERRRVMDEYKAALILGVQPTLDLLKAAELNLLNESVEAKRKMDEEELSYDDAIHQLTVIKLTKVADAMTEFMVTLDLLNETFVENKRKKVDTLLVYTGTEALPILIHPGYRQAFEMYVHAYTIYSRARSAGLDHMAYFRMSPGEKPLTGFKLFVDELALDEFNLMLEAMAELKFVVDEICEEIYPGSTPTQ